MGKRRDGGSWERGAGKREEIGGVGKREEIGGVGKREEIGGVGKRELGKEKR